MYRRRRSRLPTRERQASRILYGASAVNGTDQASYSFASLAVATVQGAHRVAYAFILNSVAGTTATDAEPTACTIGGVPGALITKWTRSITNTACVSLYVARLPGDTTATVDVTFPVTQRRAGCILASVISQQLFPSLFGILTASGTADISGPVLVPRYGFVVAMNQHNTAVANNFAFSGAGSVEVVDTTIEGGTVMAAATLSFNDILSISSANDAGMDALWIGW